MIPIAIKKHLVSPTGYDPIYRTTGLYYNSLGEKGTGNHYYISALENPASIEWVTDEWARDFIESSKEKLLKPIQGKIRLFDHWGESLTAKTNSVNDDLTVLVTEADGTVTQYDYTIEDAIQALVEFKEKEL